MNITKTEQKTIRDSKAEVANLAWLYEQEQDPVAKEDIGIVLENARFWHDIAECAILRPEQEPNPKMYSKARIAVMVAIALVLLYLCVGCQTASGLGRDITSVSDGFMEQNAKNR